MTKLLLFFRALRAGESLTDPATWKNRQLSTTAILAILYLLVTFLPVPLAPDDINAIAGGLSLIGGSINAYLTVATTEKIGLPELSDWLKKASLWVKDWRFVSAAFILAIAIIYWSLS